MQSARVLLHTCQVSTSRLFVEQPETLDLCVQVLCLAFNPCIFLTFKAHVSCLEEDPSLPGFLVTPLLLPWLLFCCLHNKLGFYGTRCYLCVATWVTSRHHTPLSVFSVGFVESISYYKYCGSVII